MKVVPGTAQDYAHLELEADEREIKTNLEKVASLLRQDFKVQVGLRIKVSESDRVPDAVRKNLADGKYFIVSNVDPVR